MHKGIFSQTLCILTEKAATARTMLDALGDFPVLGQPKPTSDWQFGGDPSVVLSFRPNVNGKVAVDYVGQKWPDDMGDPKHDYMTFGAWAMGHFGPFTYPGGLARAGQHSWN